jgi:hypothetical protein
MRACDDSSVRCDDDREQDSACKCEAGRLGFVKLRFNSLVDSTYEHSASLPRDPNSFRLRPFRPKQVEEECRAKYGGHKHANKDVEGEGSHNIIVSNRHTGRSLKIFLLIDVLGYRVGTE